MTDHLFPRVGRWLYGDDFMWRLAAEWGVDRRTVQRWTSGARTVPPDKWAALAALVRAHAGAAGDLVREIEEHME